MKEAAKTGCKMHYRYREINHGDGQVSIRLEEYTEIEETRCGYWIKGFDTNYFKKWVSKTSRKRFAYPTKDEALESFIRRKERQIEICSYQLDIAKLALIKAKEIKKCLL